MERSAPEYINDMNCKLSLIQALPIFEFNIEIFYICFLIFDFLLLNVIRHIHPFPHFRTNALTHYLPFTFYCCECLSQKAKMQKLNINVPPGQ
jgi:hypothetical protein